MPRTDPRNLRTLILLAIAFHLLIASVVIGNPIFYWSQGARSVEPDVIIFYNCIKRSFSGQIPYRDFALEYPIGAIPLFMIPGLFANDFGDYWVAFGAEMMLFDAAIILLLARRIGRDQGPSAVVLRLAWYTLFFAALCPLPTCRYDLAPTAMAFAASCAWDSGRRGLGASLAAFGTLTKIFPGVSLAPALLAEARDAGVRRGRGVRAFFTTAVAVAVVWLLIGRGGVAASFQYHARRGLELESVYAGFAYAFHMIKDIQLLIIHNFGSTNLYFPHYEIVLILSPALQIAVVLGVAWRFSDRRAGSDLRHATAALLGFLVAGKVLSPQYLIWLTPFVAGLDGRVGGWMRPVFFVCCLLTRLIFPGPGFPGLLHAHLWAVVLVNVRNLLLLLMFAVVVFHRERRTEASAPKSSQLPSPPETHP